MSDQQEDTEISLGAGKLLLLFFGLVVLCGAFFAVGYMIGKNSAPAQLAMGGSDPATTASGTPKPSSSISSPSQPMQDCATPGNCDQPTAGSDLTFYKNVEQKDPQPQLEPPPAQTQPTQNPASEAKPATKLPAPEMPKTATTGTGYLVQVAAVSKQQDADALVTYLRKKQYPVFVTNNPPNDKLFHVQAGPFADLKEAEAVKARLINDGYSPILKR